MLSSFEIYKIRNGQASNYAESIVQNSRSILDSIINESPSFTEIYIVGKRNIQARVSNYKKERLLTPTMKIVSDMNNEFEFGDIISFNDNYWIVTSSNNFYGVYYQGEITQCNGILKFQLPKSYEIYEVPCIIESPFSNSLSRDRIIQISVDANRVRTQLNEVTRRMFVGQRLVMGTKFDADGREIADTYRIMSRNPIGFSDMQNKGLIIFNIGETQEVNDDNIEFMVADYKQFPDILASIPNQSKIITPDDKFEIYMGSSIPKIFIAELFDEDMLPILEFDDVTFEWTIFASDDQLNYIRTEQVGREFKVWCLIPRSDKEYNNIFGTTFTIQLSAVRNGVQFDVDRDLIRISGIF